MASADTGSGRAATRTVEVDETLHWGIRPERANRASVRLLLALNRVRAHDPVTRKLLHLARAGCALLVASDIQTPHVGESLYLPHPFGMVVHGRVRIGDRCTLYQGITLGEDNARPGVPVLGDDVVVGAGAVVLGPVHVGDGAQIGAGAVVLQDVPAGAVAVGVPARIVEPGA